jgi:hypothetical protein
MCPMNLLCCMTFIKIQVDMRFKKINVSVMLLCYCSSLCMMYETQREASSWVAHLLLIPAKRSFCS